MNLKELKTLQLVSVRWWNASAYYAISLAEALNKSAYKSIVAGREDSPPLQRACEYGLPIFTGINLESTSPRKAIRNILSLKKILAAEQIALINAHRPEDHFFGALINKLSSQKIPLVRTVSDVRPPKDHRLNRWLHDAGTDFYIFSCKASFERYQSVWPIFEDRSAIIYSAIDTDRFRPFDKPSPLRRKFGIDDTEVVVGIVARLDPVKDHRTFLKAARIVSQKVPGVRFLISGESCNISHSQLRQFAEELGIADKTIFHERDDALNIRELLGCLDVGIVASNGSEVICRVAVEYMALGIPQVTTNINVLPEIIENGENGFAVNAGDAEAMADRILYLIQNSFVRKEMGEKARRYAETRFSYNTFVKQTVAVYEDTIEKLEI